eukprot:PhF_6_TR37845/c3_g1_i1/m.56342
MLHKVVVRVVVVMLEELGMAVAIVEEEIHTHPTSSWESDWSAASRCWGHSCHGSSMGVEGARLTLRRIHKMCWPCITGMQGGRWVSCWRRHSRCGRSMNVGHGMSGGRVSFSIWLFSVLEFMQG